MFALICAWINGWVNNREAGDLRSHRTHFDVIIMMYLLSAREVNFASQHYYNFIVCSYIKSMNLRTQVKYISANQKQKVPKTHISILVVLNFIYLTTMIIFIIIHWRFPFILENLTIKPHAFDILKCMPVLHMHKDLWNQTTSRFAVIETLFLNHWPQATHYGVMTRGHPWFGSGRHSFPDHHPITNVDIFNWG